MDIKNDPRYVHETVIRDIISIIDDITDQTKSISDKIGNTKTTFRNIARASRDLTLTFPVIVTDRTSVETASMIAKAVERKAVAMLQMLFSAISITNADDAITYLKNFHTNLDTDGNMGVDDVIAFANQISSNEAAGIEIKDKVLFETAVESFKKFKDQFLEDSVCESSLNDFHVDMSYGMRVLKESKPDFKNYSQGYKAGAASKMNQIDSLQRRLDQQAKLRDRDKEKYASDIEKANAYRGSMANQKDMSSLVKTGYDIARTRQDMMRDQTFSTDIKKANELVPSMMIINFTSMKGNTPVQASAVVGVKARLQYVTSEDMMNRIIVKNDDKNGLFNFLKATTGQISFWKDFIFAVDKAKLDSLSTSGRGSSSPIWKLLEHRAIMSKIRRWTGSVNDASAITTLVISKDEADWLKKEEHIDVMRTNVIHSVMNAYNIMCFVIVDESLEKVNFLFDDGTNSYETMSFTHLEREDGGGAYKKVINLLAKSK